MQVIASFLGQILLLQLVGLFVSTMKNRRNFRVKKSFLPTPLQHFEFFCLDVFSKKIKKICLKYAKQNSNLKKHLDSYFLFFFSVAQLHCVRKHFYFFNFEKKVTITKELFKENYNCRLDSINQMIGLCRL